MNAVQDLDIQNAFSPTLDENQKGLWTCIQLQVVSVSVF